jgi:hypothetical protein
MFKQTELLLLFWRLCFISMQLCNYAYLYANVSSIQRSHLQLIIFLMMPWFLWLTQLNDFRTETARYKHANKAEKKASLKYGLSFSVN